MNDLLARAREVRQKAYAPYSRFRVGAALEAADGTVFVGCNVENASFGMTICAERAALARAVAEGKQDFTRLAISCDGREPASPCGACRQVLAEFAPGLEMVSEAEDGRERWNLAELLPERFVLSGRVDD